jgi:hypothetical protein
LSVFGAQITSKRGKKRKKQSVVWQFPLNQRAFNTNPAISAPAVAPSPHRQRDGRGIGPSIENELEGKQRQRK